MKLNIVYGQLAGHKPQLQLIWAPVNNAPDPAAVAAAKNADVIVAVVGITSHLEGEEMPIDEPGFSGGDRTSLDLPKPEEDLVQAVAAMGKPLVVVLMNGSALGANWEKAHANAVLESWYSGEEGGAAIAQTLSGKNNPAGRLPVTFYKDVHQLPHFEDYSMKGRTYRYFEGEPLWPFGYGLSYTTFNYSDLTLPSAPIDAGNSLSASVTVSNTGKLAGDEVVQLYLKFPDVAGAIDEAWSPFVFELRGHVALATAGGTPALLWSGCGCRWFFYCGLGAVVLGFGRRGSAALGDDDVSDLDRAIWAVVGIATHARNLLHQRDAGLVALTEESVSAVQAGIGDFGDEKLGAVGAGTGVGIGQASGAVELHGRGSFILELKTNVAAAAAAGSPP